MSLQRICTLVIITVGALTVAVVATEALFDVLGWPNFLFWTANFGLLVVAVLFSIPLAVYQTYLSWQTTKSHLV